MNRKLIVNEFFAWPDINELESKQITEFLENQLKQFPYLKRKRTISKRAREKLKSAAQEGHRTQAKSNEIEEFSIEFKKRLILGINAITKCIEKNPHHIMFVLVCRSCKPLVVFTRHLQVMCSHSKIPAGCVYGLSDKLSKILNLKTVSALAICNNKLNNSEESSNDLEQVLESFNQKVIPLLKPLANSFTGRFPTSKIEPIRIDRAIELSADVKTNSELTTKKEEQFMECEESEENFGSDFISFNKNEATVSFESSEFILFNDNYVATKDRNFNEEMIENLETNINSLRENRFNQLSIIQQRSSKEKKRNKPDLKNKKMKVLEKNKFNAAKKPKPKKYF